METWKLDCLKKQVDGLNQEEWQALFERVLKEKNKYEPLFTQRQLFDEMIEILLQVKEAHL